MCPKAPSVPHASVPVTSIALFSFLPGRWRVHKALRPLLSSSEQEFVTLKEEGERGRKMFCGVLRISISQQRCWELTWSSHRKTKGLAG